MGNMRKSPGMPRRKYKSDFPHVVEMVVPEGGLRNRRVAMFDFHKAGLHRKCASASIPVSPLTDCRKTRKGANRTWKYHRSLQARAPLLSFARLPRGWRQGL